MSCGFSVGDNLTMIFSFLCEFAMIGMQVLWEMHFCVMSETQ